MLRLSVFTDEELNEISAVINKYEEEPIRFLMPRPIKLEPLVPWVDEDIMDQSNTAESNEQPDVSVDFDAPIASCVVESQFSDKNESNTAVEHNAEISSIVDNIQMHFDEANEPNSLHITALDGASSSVVDTQFLDANHHHHIDFSNTGTTRAASSSNNLIGIELRPNSYTENEIISPEERSGVIAANELNNVLPTNMVSMKFDIISGDIPFQENVSIRLITYFLFFFLFLSIYFCVTNLYY